MTLFEVATLATNVAIGLGQIGIIWYGIRAMTRSTKDRSDEHDKRHAEAMTAQDKHHTEAMVALNALIDGQRDDRRALHELIARTAPAQPTS